MGVGSGVYGEKLVMLSPLLLPPAGCRYHKSGPYYWSFTFPIQPLFQPLLQFLLVKTSVRQRSVVCKKGSSAEVPEDPPVTLELSPIL
jgi:hypothetical protein